MILLTVNWYTRVFSDLGAKFHLTYGPDKVFLDAGRADILT